MVVLVLLAGPAVSFARLLPDSQHVFTRQLRSIIVADDCDISDQ